MLFFQFVLCQDISQLYRVILPESSYDFPRYTICLDMDPAASGVPMANLQNTRIFVCQRRTCANRGPHNKVELPSVAGSNTDFVQHKWTSLPFHCPDVKTKFPEHSQHNIDRISLNQRQWPYSHPGRSSRAFGEPSAWPRASPRPRAHHHLPEH